MKKHWIDEANELQWWHRIRLSPEYTTPGICAHEVDVATSRFGMPEDLTHKSVLDIGAYDGMFSFEAERRGSPSVTAVDKFQKGGRHEPLSESLATFNLAKKVLNSSVEFYHGWLEDVKRWKADVVLYYGVLYHIKNPLEAIETLAQIAQEQCLIETTYAQDQSVMRKPVLEYRPGFDNDPTNYFYPSLSWLDLACRQSGFKKTELVYSDGIRCTIRAIK